MHLRVTDSDNDLCIYCLQRSKQFTREHVVPDAFGKFRHALTVVGAVCGKCNQYFGDTLDLALGRESVEGLFRYQFGVKPAHEVRKFRTGRRVKMRLATGTEAGTLVRVVPRVDGSGLAVEQIPQIRVYEPETGVATSYTEEEVALTDWPAVGQISDGARIELLAYDDEGTRRMAALLRSKGLPGRFEDLPPVSFDMAVGQEAPVNVSVEIDEEQRRSIAKISFNYLAAVRGKAFALESDFNEIRHYIRFGIYEVERTGIEPATPAAWWNL